jgi:hypothetical protein
VAFALSHRQAIAQSTGMKPAELARAAIAVATNAPDAQALKRKRVFFERPWDELIDEAATTQGASRSRKLGELAAMGQALMSSAGDGQSEEGGSLLPNSHRAASQQAVLDLADPSDAVAQIDADQETIPAADLATFVLGGLGDLDGPDQEELRTALRTVEVKRNELNGFLDQLKKDTTRFKAKRPSSWATQSVSKAHAAVRKASPASAPAHAAAASKVSRRTSGATMGNSGYQAGMPAQVVTSADLTSALLDKTGLRQADLGRLVGQTSSITTAPAWNRTTALNREVPGINPAEAKRQASPGRDQPTQATSEAARFRSAGASTDPETGGRPIQDRSAQTPADMDLVLHPDNYMDTASGPRPLMDWNQAGAAWLRRLGANGLAQIQPIGGRTVNTAMPASLRRLALAQQSFGSARAARTGDGAGIAANSGAPQGWFGAGNNSEPAVTAIQGNTGRQPTTAQSFDFATPSTYLKSRPGVAGGAPQYPSGPIQALAQTNPAGAYHGDAYGGGESGAWESQQLLGPRPSRPNGQSQDGETHQMDRLRANYEHDRRALAKADGGGSGAGQSGGANSAKKAANIVPKLVDDILRETEQSIGE